MPKRPIIVQCTTDFEIVYANMLCRGICDAAEHYDCHVIVLPGKGLKIPYDYQYQYNVLYDYMDRSGVDGIIVSGGALANFVDKQYFSEWCERFRPIPMVSIAAPIPYGPEVRMEGYGPFGSLIEHLIRDHGRSRIAYISGSEHNSDAIARYQAYRDTLDRNGILFDPALFFQGDFTHFAGAAAIATFMDQRKVRFDAIAAANDEMAIAALAALRDRGIRVPEDVSIIGFDDVIEAAAAEPPLTTVRQPVYQQGWKSVELLLSLMGGKSPGDLVLPGHIVKRESCGCPPSVSNEVRDLKQELSLATRPEAADDTTPLDELTRRAQVRPGVRVDKLSEFVASLAHSSAHNQPPGDEALRLLSSCINPAVATGEDVKFLHSVISTLREIAMENTAVRGKRRTGKSDTDLPKSLQDFFDNARLIVGEKLTHIDSRRWDVHERDLRELHHLMNLTTARVNSPEELFDAMVPSLSALGFDFCSIWLYDNPILHGRDDSWTKPEYMQLALSFSSASDGHLIQSNRATDTNGIYARAFLGSEKRRSLVANPLFLLNEQLGLIINELDLSRKVVYESLCVQLSTVLKLSYLISTRVEIESRLRDALHDLEAYNQHLNSISRTDELTGLFNRRGFLHISRQTLNLARSMGKGGMLCFADLNGLKTINDTYGHGEGDAAIKAMSEILRHVFRSADLIARMGGDEFTVLTMDTPEDFEPILARRIGLALEVFNLQSGKPWALSFEFGCVPFEANNEKSIDTLLAEADFLLYARKRAR